MSPESSSSSKEESAGSLIFLHGFPFDSFMWKQCVEHFKKQYHCYTPDLRGLGQSDPGSGQYTMETLVDDLFRYIDENSIENPVLCGFSMGGYVVLRALEREQSRFRAAILCNTRSSPDDTAGKLKRAAGIAQIDAAGAAPFVEDFLGSVFTLKYRREKDAEYREMLTRCQSFSPVGLKGGLLAMVSRTDTTPFLSQIKIPVLLVGGRFDTVTPPDGMRAMAQQIPGASYVEAPEAGHMSPVESPEFVNAALDEFLAAL